MCFWTKKVASQLSIHRKLAELKIDQFANRNSKVMTCLTSESIQDFLKPYRFDLRKHILTRVFDNILVEEAFELHVPNFKTTLVNMNKPRQIDIKSSWVHYLCMKQSAHGLKKKLRREQHHEIWLRKNIKSSAQHWECRKNILKLNTKIRVDPQK